ncbi:MAG: LPXTG cell wall anchor domain-containing protein, partial [Firmicutes bacterium]|nr:LPXTG cell wall anchor domain-containing protein [Bacillota bacterium]
DTDGDGIADKNLLGVEVKLPKTGDSIHSGLYIAMAEMIISALGIVLFIRKRKASEM